LDCENALQDIVRDHPEFRENTLARIKSFLFLMFKLAMKKKYIKEGPNPAQNAEYHCANKAETTHAYSLSDVLRIIKVIEHPTAKALFTLIGWTGLRRSEAVGLKWSDYDASVLWVRRNICSGLKGEASVVDPKTDASKAPVPVIPSLLIALDEWKRESKPISDNCWMFPSAFTRTKNHPSALLDDAQLTPVDSGNILRQHVLPKLDTAKIEWRGYHAFRRGLATNLHDLGVDDKTIQAILRHSNVAVTQAAYIKSLPHQSINAMHQIEEAKKLAEQKLAAHEQVLADQMLSGLGLVQ
jgi:integrase